MNKKYFIYYLNSSFFLLFLLYLQKIQHIKQAQPSGRPVNMGLIFFSRTKLFILQ